MNTPNRGDNLANKIEKIMASQEVYIDDGVFSTPQSEIRAALAEYRRPLPAVADPCAALKNAHAEGALREGGQMSDDIIHFLNENVCIPNGDWERIYRAMDFDRNDRRIIPGAEYVTTDGTTCTARVILDFGMTVRDGDYFRTVTARDVTRKGAK